MNKQKKNSWNASATCGTFLSCDFNIAPQEGGIAIRNKVIELKTQTYSCTLYFDF